MILTCPNCTTRFLLSAQVLAPEGRRVKCSACGEEWFQLPDPDELVDNEQHEIEDIPEAVKPVPEGSSVPALPEDVPPQEKPSKIATATGYAGAFAVFLIGLCFLVAVKPTLLKAWPTSAAIYELIGMEVKAPGEGLVFDKVKAHLTDDDTIVIEGSIINLTAEEQFLPSVEASIRDEGGETIKKTVIHPPYDSMKPESTLPFRSVYKGKTRNADHVQIRFVLTAEKPKTVSKDGDNNQAPQADDHAEKPGGEAH